METWLYRVDLWVIAIYLLAMLIVALCVSSGARDVEGYIVGNRRMGGWVLGFSVLGTFLSSITFLGLPAKTFQSDWNAFVFGLALPPAALVATLFFVPLYRTRSRLSAYELLEQRFGAWARVYADISYLVLQLIRIGTVLLLVAFAVEPMLHVVGDGVAPLHNSDGQIGRMVGILIVLGGLVIVYDTIGGIKAVIWTDVLQVFVLVLGAVWCLAAVLFAWKGGIGSFFSAIPPEKISLGPLANYDSSTHSWNWALPSVLVVFIYGLSENLRNYGNDQNYVQRMLAARSNGEAAKSIWIGALSYVPLSVIFCLIGTALWMEANTSGNSILPADIEADQAFPYFIRHRLPPLVSGLVISAIMAAAMSTIDSCLNSCSTILLVDVLRPLRLVPKRFPEIVTLRLCTITFGAIGTLMAAILLVVKGQSGSKVLMDLWWQYAGTAGGGMFGLFLLAWLMPRIPTWSAALGVLLSIPVLAWGTFARGIEDPAWQWLNCSLHPYLVGVAGTLVILAVGAVFGLGVRMGMLRENQRYHSSGARNV
jgi:SSS family solute:Na+ symporter